VKEQVELAPTTKNSTELFYLPHHVVKKECRGKIKWRIVFDVSFSEDNNPSLNDVLEMGPNIFPEVLTILLRIRGQPVGNKCRHPTSSPLTLDRKDRDPTRFVWYRISQYDKGNRYTTNEMVT